MTLIEMVIAMLVMSIAVVGIVAALTAMLELTSEHRGHAVIETGSRSFGETAQQQAQFTTKLTAIATSGAGTLTVADTSLLPRLDGVTSNANTYVSVDREVMRVTAISATSLTVSRDVNGDAAVAHAVGAAVVPIMRCPTSIQLTPASGTYEAVTGVSPTITAVEYWNPVTSTFTDRATCLSNYTTTCTAAGQSQSAECGYGLFRASITVTTPGDARLRNVTTSTQILLRSGSS